MKGEGGEEKEEGEDEVASLDSKVGCSVGRQCPKPCSTPVATEIGLHCGIQSNDTGFTKAKKNFNSCFVLINADLFCLEACGHWQLLLGYLWWFWWSWSSAAA